MKFCTNCGNQLPAEQKFCTKCGAQQKPVEAAPAPAPVEPTPPPVEVAPEPVFTPEPVATLEPTPTPEPAPIKKSPEYPNVMQLVLALGNAGLVDDVIDEPAELAGEAKSAWSLNQLAAVIHNSGTSEYRIVLADGNLNPGSYASLTSGSSPAASARYGNWVIAVDHISGTNESAQVLEKVFETLG